MTCEDFTRISRSNPLDVTAAERAGSTVHYHSCESCRNSFHTETAELEARIGPLAKVLIGVIALRMVKTQIAEDMKDPEVKEILSEGGLL